MKVAIAQGCAGAAKHRMCESGHPWRSDGRGRAKQAGIVPDNPLHSRHCTWMCRCREAHGRDCSRQSPAFPPSMAVRCARAAIHGGQMCRCREAHGKDCSCNPSAFPPLHMDVQVPRSTWQGLLLQSSCIPAIHGGQMCESGHPWRSDVRERPRLAGHAQEPSRYGGRLIHRL